MRAQFTIALSVVLTGIVQFGTSIPNELRRADSTSVVPSEAITHKELGPQLSKGASIYFPDNSQFTNLTERWSTFTTPKYALVVVPAVGEDVAAAVCTILTASSIPVDRVLPGQIRQQVQTSFSCCKPRARYSDFFVKRQTRGEYLRPRPRKHRGSCRPKLRLARWRHVRRSSNQGVGNVWKSR